MIFINTSAKTSWFRLLLIIGLTCGALYLIIDAWQKPFVNWQNYNEIHGQDLNQFLNN